MCDSEWNSCTQCRLYWHNYIASGIIVHELLTLMTGSIIDVANSSINTVYRKS